MYSLNNIFYFCGVLSFTCWLRFRVINILIVGVVSHQFSISWSVFTYWKPFVLKCCYILTCTAKKTETECIHIYPINYNLKKIFFRTSLCNCNCLSAQVVSVSSFTPDCFCIHKIIENLQYLWFEKQHPISNRSHFVASSSGFDFGTFCTTEMNLLLMIDVCDFDPLI